MSSINHTTTEEVRSPHDGGRSPEGILVYRTHIVSNENWGGKQKKNNCTAVKSKRLSFVNCQQHKYFVSLFVPFL